MRGIWNFVWKHGRLRMIGQNGDADMHDAVEEWNLATMVIAL